MPWLTWRFNQNNPGNNYNEVVVDDLVVGNADGMVKAGARAPEPHHAIFFYNIIRFE